MMNNKFSYSCEACGANEDSRPADCCDECIVKFYLRSTKAPSIDQYSHWVEHEQDEVSTCAVCLDDFDTDELNDAMTCEACQASKDN